MMHNVAFFTEEIYNGGAEKVSRELLNIENEIIKTRLVSMYPSHHELEEYIKQKLFILDIKYPKTNYKPIFILYRGIYFVKSIFEYKKYLIENNIDISIDNSVCDIVTIFNYLSCFGTRTLPISTKHALHYYSPTDIEKRGKLQLKIRTLIYLQSLKHMKYLIAVSNSVVDFLVASGIPKERIVMIYNPVDIQNIQTHSLEPISDKFYDTSTPIILTVGRLEIIKGHWHLIRVFRNIRQTFPCKLVICGDGSMRNYLQNLVDSWNLSEDVLFTGHVDNPYKYFRNSTVFVLPSLSESFSLAILEAMACSCPVLAAHSGGPAEILGDNYYGLLSSPLTNDCRDMRVELNDGEKDMRDKLLQLLSDKKLRDTYIRKGLERVKDFDKEIAYDNYRYIIKSISK